MQVSTWGFISLAAVLKVVKTHSNFPLLHLHKLRRVSKLAAFSTTTTVSPDELATHVQHATLKLGVVYTPLVLVVEVVFVVGGRGKGILFVRWRGRKAIVVVGEIVCVVGETIAVIVVVGICHIILEASVVVGKVVVRRESVVVWRVSHVVVVVVLRIAVIVGIIIVVDRIITIIVVVRWVVAVVFGGIQSGIGNCVLILIGGGWVVGSCVVVWKRVIVE